VARALTTSEEVADGAGAAIAGGGADRAGARGRASAGERRLVYNRTLASIFDGISARRRRAGGGRGAGRTRSRGCRSASRTPGTRALQITQPLYTAGGWARRWTSRATCARADLQVEEAEADIALQVRNAYFQTVLAEEMVGIAREAYQLATRTCGRWSCSASRARHRSSTCCARGGARQPGAGHHRGENARRLAELNLKRLANVPAEQPIDLVTPLDPRIADVDREALRAALRAVRRCRRWTPQVAAREGAVRIARRTGCRASARGNFAYQAFPLGVAPFDTDWRRDWTLSLAGVGADLHGFRTRGQIDQARAELRRRSCSVRRSAGLELELEAALGEFDAARAQIEARRATVGRRVARWSWPSCASAAGWRRSSTSPTRGCCCSRRA
jgi:hypothetical protein